MTDSELSMAVRALSGRVIFDGKVKVGVAPCGMGTNVYVDGHLVLSSHYAIGEYKVHWGVDENDAINKIRSLIMLRYNQMFYECDGRHVNEGDSVINKINSIDLEALS